MISALLALVLAAPPGGVKITNQTPATTDNGWVMRQAGRNTLADWTAVRCISADGLSFESCAGGASGSGLTDAQLRATPVPVSGTVTASGPLTDTQLRATPVPVSGTVTASGPLTDTQLRATPVPVSGTVASTGIDYSGTARNIATTSAGVVYVQAVGGFSPTPANALSPRCNAVRRSNCQP